MKSFEQAIADYGEAIRLDPDYIEAYNNRAIAYLMCRQLEHSQQDWQKAIDIDNRRSTIRHNLKILFEKLRGKGVSDVP